MARKAAEPGDEQFRKSVADILSDPYPWNGYEAQLEWLERLLKRPADYEFTRQQREAVQRIQVARTRYEGWNGYSVDELARGAAQYAADFSDEDDEIFVKDIVARQATSLTWSDMKRLVSLCRVAGMDVAKFDPVLQLEDELA